MYYKKRNKIYLSIFLQVLGMLILLSLTLYGILTFHNESWEKFLEILYNKKGVFLLVLGFRILDWVVDYIVWRFVLSFYGVSVSFINSVLIYLTQGAGILLPAQLGRVLRGYVLSKKLNVSLDLSLIVEGYMLFLVFNGAFFIFLIFLGMYANMRLVIWTMAFLILTVVWTFVKYGEEFLVRWFPGVPKVKNGYISYMLLCIVCGLGWAINGLIFYCLVQSSEIGLFYAETQLMLLGGIFLSAISGIPGGIGILETTLGVSLHWLNVKMPEIIVVVGAFRLVTVGLWIPIGWIALVLLGYRRIYQSLREEVK